ncbi:YvcK family protein [Eggerthellaceae bacterium zg-997]|nr:YvcK family protein [Eggerthellaceae bacterium zg-997]
MSESAAVPAEGPFAHDPGSTAAFAALEGLPTSRPAPDAPRAVVIGGGTGAPMSIRTLLSLGVATDAVVAMADDGGSTGILRAAAGATAPGDIRKCLSAMAADSSDPLTEAFRLRFTFAENHTLGNLLLSALEQTAGSFPEAIAVCEGLLHARGHVHPSTLGRVMLEADTVDGRVVRGQALASHSRCALDCVRLRSEVPIEAYAPAVEAIRAADLIVLGPGSLFTSIVPNLLVPGIVQAVRASRATVVFVCSLADVQGETRGMTALDHVEALRRHGMQDLIDVMVAHGSGPVAASGSPAAAALSASGAADGVHARAAGDGAGPGAGCDAGPVRPVALSPDDARAIQQAGIRLVVRDLVDRSSPTWHDPARLRAVMQEVLSLCRS